MNNIFLDLPDFINSDPRITRGTTTSGSYNINAKLQYIRHSITLPKSIVNGASVLDLGCCVGATGAWVLKHGATRYVGVDIESNYCDLANKNLSAHFNNTAWEIYNYSFSEFFRVNQDKFDLVIAWGVVYSSIEIESFIQQLALRSTHRILIDSVVPPHIVQLKKLNILDSDIDSLAISQLVNRNTMINSVHSDMKIKSAMVTLPYLSEVLANNNFSLEHTFTEKLTELLSTEYINRFCVSFISNNLDSFVPSYETHYQPSPLQLSSVPWKFDKQVADDFVNHARHHIPSYINVITKSVNICKKLIDPFDSQYKIIDVGCATGETIRHLSQAGFNNIVGVDSSDSMLDQARKDGIDKISYLINCSTFPTELGPYRTVLCNWTLHFIKNKISYLTDIYNSLEGKGFLIITDKTYNGGADLELYHEFKKTQGVSNEDIASKAISVNDIMFIDPPEWYLDTLRAIGFTNVSIIDADYCFTSFLAIKN